MTGIFLVIVVAIWILFIKWLTPKIVSSIKHARLKQVASVLVFLLLLVLPVIDEIIGGIQFHSLCKEGAVITGSEEEARDKDVIVKLSNGQNVNGTIIAIREQSWSYFDANTNTLLFSYKVFHAHGGLLIKMLGISETNAPLTFDNACGPSNVKTIFKRLNMKIVNK